jgi:hypothetical protein
LHRVLMMAQGHPSSHHPRPLLTGPDRDQPGMGGRIERIIRASVSWTRRSPASRGWNYRMKALFAPVDSAIDWEGRGPPRSRTGNWTVRA